MTAPAQTTAAPFHFLPGSDTHLFQVNAGCNTDFAVSRAELLETYVREALSNAAEDGVTTDQCQVLSVMLEMAGALRVAAGQVA